MGSSFTTFVGIELGSGRKPFAYAALDARRRILALGGGLLEDVLAFAAGQSSTLVAITVPGGPNQGVVASEEASQSLIPNMTLTRRTNLRLAEKQLIQMGLPAPKTPMDPAGVPARVRLGFRLRRELESFGYKAYPAEEAARQWLEVFPTGCFWAWLRRTLPVKQDLLEGRLQRQLVLEEQGVQVPDAMGFFEELTRFKLLRGILPANIIYSPGELNALAGAYTAWLTVHQPHAVRSLGDSAEGLIFLPRPREEENSADSR